MKNFRQRIVTHPAVLQSATDKFNALFDEPAEVAELAELEKPDFGLDFVPDLILVHICRFPEITKCRCKKKVSYAEALTMTRHGEANWVTLVTASGNKKVPALTTTTLDKIKRATVPNSGSAEILAEVSLANKQNRKPDVSGLFEAAAAAQEEAQKKEIVASLGKSVGGMIQTTTRVRNGKEESRGTFDESSHPEMTGPVLEYSTKDGKPKRPAALKRDRSGSETSTSDNYGPDSKP